MNTKKESFFLKNYDNKKTELFLSGTLKIAFTFPNLMISQ